MRIYIVLLSGKENTYGTVVGRVRGGPFTYCRVSTDDERGAIVVPVMLGLALVGLTSDRLGGVSVVIQLLCIAPALCNTSGRRS